MGIAGLHKLAPPDGRGNWARPNHSISRRHLAVEGEQHSARTKLLRAVGYKPPRVLEQWPWERTKAPRYQCEGTLYACFPSGLTQGACTEMATSMYEHNYTSNGGALNEENIHTRNFLFGCEAVHLALESFVSGSWRLTLKALIKIHGQHRPADVQ